MHILRCMGSNGCVKFQRAPLKFHTKFWTHTPPKMHFTVFYFCVWVTIYLNCDVIRLSETGPRTAFYLFGECRQINPSTIVTEHNFNVSICKYKILIYNLTLVLRIYNHWQICPDSLYWETVLFRHLNIILKKCAVGHMGGYTKILIHWGREKASALFLMTYFCEFSWKKIFEFGLKYHLKFFLRV